MRLRKQKGGNGGGGGGRSLAHGSKSPPALIEEGSQSGIGAPEIPGIILGNLLLIGRLEPNLVIRE